MEEPFLRDDQFESRPVGLDDLPALLALYQQCEDFLALGPQPEATPEMVETDLSASQWQGGVYYGLYLRDGVLAGVLDVVPSGYGGEQGTAFLSLLMIGAAFRRQGLGRVVVEALERRLHGQGITTLRGGVQVNNPGGIAFWRCMGFEIDKQAEHFDDGTSGYRMQRNLRPVAE